MKILFVIGTRPELIKMAPVYKLFQEDEMWDVSLVSTGQHHSMLNQLYDFFEIYPDHELDIMTNQQTLSNLTSSLINKLTLLLEQLKPNFVAVQGDTATTFSASLSAYFLKIPVIHIEAGLRTYDNYSPFPEEANRRMTSTIARYHFCPTVSGQLNLFKENIKDDVYVIGNTVVDSLLWANKKIKNNLEQYQRKFNYISTSYQRMVLVTAHRRESFNGGIRNVAFSVKELAAKHKDIAFVFPVHKNPNVKNVIDMELDGIDNVFLMEPLDYDDMVYLMDSSYIIMTDSGGIQEEAPSLNVPVLVLRETTERVEAIHAGTAILAGNNKVSIINAFEELHNNKGLYKIMTTKENPYGAGNSSIQMKRIFEDLVRD